MPYLKKRIGLAILAATFIYLILYFGLNFQLSNLRSLWPRKDSSGLERYACLFRSSRVSKKQYCDLLHGEGEFLKHVQEASKAFHIPAPVLFCTTLIESGFDYRARSGRNRGYGQFSQIAVNQLKSVIKTPRYKQMWEAYTEKPIDKLNTSNVMLRKDPEIPLAAISLYARWMFDRIDRLECAGCGPSFLLTDKKIALMIAGYNWSPYKFKQFVHLSLSELTNKKTSPLPTISQKYIHSMNYCQSSGEYERLRPGHTVQDKRLRQCQVPVCEENSNSTSSGR